MQLSTAAKWLYQELLRRADECYWSPNHVNYEANEYGLNLTSEEIVYISNNLPQGGSMIYTKEQIERIKLELEVVTERELDADHCNILNEMYGTINICGLDYDAADALRSTDPVAFRCSFSDYIDSRDDVIEIAGECYSTSEVEDLIEKMEEADI